MKNKFLVFVWSHFLASRALQFIILYISIFLTWNSEMLWNLKVFQAPRHRESKALRRFLVDVVVPLCSRCLQLCQHFPWFGTRQQAHTPLLLAYLPKPWCPVTTLWSDECAVHLSTGSQNVYIWAKENSRFFEEVVHTTAHITVWAWITCELINGPYSFYASVAGENYVTGWFQNLIIWVF